MATNAIAGHLYLARRDDQQGHGRSTSLVAGYHVYSRAGASTLDATINATRCRV